MSWVPAGYKWVIGRDDGPQPRGIQWEGSVDISDWKSGEFVKGEAGRAKRLPMRMTRCATVRYIISS